MPHFSRCVFILHAPYFEALTRGPKPGGGFFGSLVSTHNSIFVMYKIYRNYKENDYFEVQS